MQNLYTIQEATVWIEYDKSPHWQRVRQGCILSLPTIHAEYTLMEAKVE